MMTYRIGNEDCFVDSCWFTMEWRGWLSKFLKICVRKIHITWIGWHWEGCAIVLDNALYLSFHVKLTSNTSSKTANFIYSLAIIRELLDLIKVHPVLMVNKMVKKLWNYCAASTTLYRCRYFKCNRITVALCKRISYVGRRKWIPIYFLNSKQVFWKYWIKYST